jgi:hypothetical protein
MEPEGLLRCSRNPPSDIILSQKNPVHSHTIFKTHLSIILIYA